MAEMLELLSTPSVGATLIWITDKLIMGFLILIKENLRTGGTYTHDTGKKSIGCKIFIAKLNGN